MKIALISSTFPPDHCGVGDHSAKLAAALARAGHEVSVWTLQARPQRLPGVEVRTLPKPWGRLALSRLNAGLEKFQPEAILVQFTPFLFSPEGGLNALLVPAWISWARLRLKARVSLYAHELFYPLELSVAGLLLGVPQFHAFSAMALLADQIFFSYEVPLRRYRRWLPWRAKRFHWLPVGANIEPSRQRPGKAALLRGMRIPERSLVLLHFGGPHVTHLLDWALAALEHAAANPRIGEKAYLVFMGIDPKAVAALLKRLGKNHLKAHVRTTGYVDASTASGWLGAADILLAPLLDGVCTRRGSVMAALAHGTPVATTLGYHSDKSVAWSRFCATVQNDRTEKSRAKYAALVTELLLSSKRRQALGAAGKVTFTRAFEWDHLATALAKKL